MKQTILPAAAIGLILTLAPFSAQAKSANADAPQASAFEIGYTLRISDLHAIAFTQSVKTLKTIDDDRIAGAEVAHLSHQTVGLRRAQALAYRQIMKILTTMGAPKTLHAWAAQTAETLNAPLMYSSEAKSLAKQEPDTATVLAELDEIQTVKASANAQQPILAAWLKLKGGDLSVWTADVGSYTAYLHSATLAANRVSLPLGVAKRLVKNAPKGAPPEVRDALVELIPRAGNLQEMATLPPADVSPEKMHQVYEKLLNIFGLRRQAEKLDD